MPTLVAGSAFDMEDLIANGSISEFFELGTVTTQTETTFVVDYTDQDITERLTLTGLFENYVDGYPTTGVISSISYSVNGSTLFTITDVQITVEAFTAYAQADNLAGLFQDVLSGADLLTGSDGDDHLIGFGGDDTIESGAGNDTLEGGDGNDSLRGGTGNDHAMGGAGNDFFSESSGDNGPFGDDIYDGGEGVDRVSYFTTYGTGTTLTVDLTVNGAQNTGQGNDTLISIEHVTGSYGDNVITGNDTGNWIWTFWGNDVLTGNGGNDLFTVGQGTKTINGGTGSDTVEVSDTAFEPAYGMDGVTVSLLLQGQAQNVGIGTWTLTNVENLGGWYGNDRLTGDDNANILAGYEGSDVLVGGGGNDVLSGDGGYNIGYDGSAWDLVEDPVEVEWNYGNDILDGGAGDDQLYGGGGDDTLTGGTGNDYLNGGAGFDIATYATASAGVRIDLRNTGAQNTVGAGVDTLISIERVIGSNFNDILQGSSGNETLQGGAGDDYIYGHGGDDVIQGGAGVDRLLGGAGNDTYYVVDSTDYIYENAGEGTDQVFSTVSLALRDNIENLGLQGSANIVGTGNDLANTIVGNSGANRLYGLGGDDIIYGGDGNDRIEGGAGADVMYGGAGNDIYAVTDVTDTVVENAGEGIDTVYSTVSYTLGDHVDRLYLTGTANLNGTGGSTDNVINGNIGNNVLMGMGGDDILYGHAGDDTLNGGTGVDRLIGGEGNDTYYVDDATSYVYEAAGEGFDIVFASVSHALRDNIEDLYLTGTANINGTGNASNNRIIGNEGANVLRGGDGADELSGDAGNDILDGGTGDDFLYAGTGQDRMYGGLGADTFSFRSNGDFSGTTLSTADRIHDFSQADGDVIDLLFVDADTTAEFDNAFTFIANAEFSGTAGELRYELVNGNTHVYGDTDGDGNADFMILLDGSHNLVAGDFIL